jgi:hypothetical protein
LLDWARQAALQIHRWLPDRYIVLVADSAFAAIEFLAAVRDHFCVVTRLRLDANLFDFPSRKRKGRGRRPIKGKPLKKLSAIIKDRRVIWQRYRVSLWYGRTNRLVEISTGTALWYRGGVPPVPIRWLLVRWDTFAAGSKTIEQSRKESAERRANKKAGAVTVTALGRRWRGQDFEREGEIARLSCCLHRLPDRPSVGAQNMPRPFSASTHVSWLPAASPLIVQLRMGLRCRLAIRSSVAVDERSSLSSAH